MVVGLLSAMVESEKQKKWEAAASLSTKTKTKLIINHEKNYSLLKSKLTHIRKIIRLRLMLSVCATT